MEQKIEPIVGTIEPSMYVGRPKFNWAKAHKTQNDPSDYIKEIIFNVISVHAEVTRFFPRNSNVIENVMFKLVEKVSEEINR